MGKSRRFGNDNSFKSRRPEDRQRMNKNKKFNKNPRSNRYDRSDDDSDYDIDPRFSSKWNKNDSKY